MIKEYSQNRNNVIINFSIKYCKTSDELLSSFGFKKVLSKYIHILEKQDSLLIENLKTYVEGNLSDYLTNLFKLLIIMDVSKIEKEFKEYNSILESNSLLFEFIEGLYNYWRRLERYSLIQSSNTNSGIQSINLVEANNNFSNLILKVYRKIEENIINKKHNVYRQLSAGINAGIVLAENTQNLPNEYKVINNVQFIKSIVLTPPLILFPKRNTRSGYFEEVFQNPIENLKLNKSHFFCFPAKVGDSLAFIYFHRDFMNLGISLANLFELATEEEFLNTKPNLVLVFGARLTGNPKKTVFYSDKKNDIYTGLISNTEEVDYFGYMKKIILTLHNIRMIDNNHLPIHGAMVHVVLKSGKTANIVIVGDSGAGKSESLEAFRSVSKKYLKEMKIIFDDMGTFKITNNQVYGYGTEIGAFVRLDDLESGYAFKKMDRAIFMNPGKVNSRVLIPVSTYNEIMNGYKVDILLYANNYEKSKKAITIFEDKEKAKDVFVKALRKAKGTTSETGIVESFFANPFGPHQRKEQTNKIIDSVFSNLFDNNILVGEIYTMLAIDGYEQKGPKKVATKLFDWINETEL